MNSVQTIEARDLTREECIGIGVLFQLIWPSASDGEPDVATDLKWMRAQTTTYFVICDDGKIRAQALLFLREIFTEFGPIQIGALGGVCVHPAFRGRGWGADVAWAAFDYLPQLNAAVSLFQTPVPKFYEKLGCRLVDNAFFDGTCADGVKSNPFADRYQMIYPATFDWPSGEIDINGSGY